MTCAQNSSRQGYYLPLQLSLIKI